MKRTDKITRCSSENPCGRIMNPREISLYKGMVYALYKVHKYVKKRENGYYFTRKEIKHLFKSENETARFGDWVLFGGLVFKQRKAHYGLNMERCADFFSGLLAIPTICWKHPNGEIEMESEKYIHDFPKLQEFLDKENMFVATYGGPIPGKIPVKKEI